MLSFVYQSEYCSLLVVVIIRLQEHEWLASPTKMPPFCKIWTVFCIYQVFGQVVKLLLGAIQRFRRVNVLDGCVKYAIQKGSDPLVGDLREVQG